MAHPRAEKSRIIGSLLAGYPSSSITPLTVDAYLNGVDGFDVDVVQIACQRFADGLVDRDNHYAPSAPEIVVQCRYVAELVEASQRRHDPVPEAPEGYNRLPGGLLIVRSDQPVPAGFEPLGPLRVDFGHGPIDLKGKTYRQKEWVLKHKRLPKPEEVPEFEALAPAVPQRMLADA